MLRATMSTTRLTFYGTIRDNWHPTWGLTSINILYSWKVWWRECLANLFSLSVWQKKVWQMNRLAKGLSMVTTNLDVFSLDDSPNSPTFQSTKLSGLHIWYIRIPCCQIYWHQRYPVKAAKNLFTACSIYLLVNKLTN